MKAHIKKPYLTLTLNWSGELPAELKGKLKNQWAKLPRPRTIKIKL